MMRNQGARSIPLCVSLPLIHEHVVLCAEAKECQSGHTIILTRAHPVAGQRVRNKRGNSTHTAVPAGSLPFERHVILPRVEIRRAFGFRDVPVDLYSYYRASIGKWLGQKCVRNESTSSRTIGLLLPLETVSTLGMSECCYSRQLLGTLSQLPLLV
jgi:hypothetical protein